MSLGLFRLLLALVVLNGHLHGPWWPASFAVFSFYLISGFLMTWIMKGKYGFTRSGIVAFCVNRLLRIHPPYYAAAALSLGLMLWLGEDATLAFNDKLRIPRTLAEIVPNITLLGLSWDAPSRLVPPAWALHVELCSYLLIALFFGRSLRWALVWLAGSLGYLLWLRATGDATFGARYANVLAAGLPFSVGCCFFHAQPWLRNHMSKRAGRLELSLCCAGYAGALAVAALSSNPKGWPFYLNLAATLPLINALSRTTWQSERLRRADKLAGDLSYPVYLVHWQAGLLAHHALGLAQGTLPLMFAATAVAIAFGLFERSYVSGLVERGRKAITRGAAARRRASAPPLVRPSWLPSLRASRTPQPPPGE